MLLKTPIEYIQFGKTTNADGTRHYDTPDGPLPSVTTILGATGDKSGLDAWRKRLGEEQANLQSREATGLGTLLHTHLENYAMGIPRPKGNNMVRKMAEYMADAIIGRGLINVSEIWALEQPLWFPGLYAGTADLVIVHNGVLAIGDYKTTKKPKKDQWVIDYKLQLTAYALAHNEVYGTTIKKGVIFMVSRDGQYQEWIVEGIEFDKMSAEWYNRVELFLNKEDK